MLNEITKSLEVLFSELDADFLVRHKAWAVSRVAAIKEYKANNKCTYATTKLYYDGLFSVAGGKNWYGIFDGRNNEDIMIFIEKNCAAIIEKRNFNIAQKLINSGVKKLSNGTYAHSHDGFNGVWHVDTDNGAKVVTIETILAGGYNIQVLHQRTLVKVK